LTNHFSISFVLGRHYPGREEESVAPHCSTWDPGGGVGSRSEGWSWVGLGVGLGIRGGAG